jgi:hypothetical protein
MGTSIALDYRFYRVASRQYWMFSRAADDHCDEFDPHHDERIARPLDVVGSARPTRGSRTAGSPWIGAGNTHFVGFSQGQPLQLDGGVKGSDGKGLWGIFAFGNGNGTGPTNTLYFTSGFNDEDDGLFGTLTATSIATGSASSTASVTAKAVRTVVVPGATRFGTLLALPVANTPTANVLGTLNVSNVDTIVATDLASIISGPVHQKAENPSGV